MIRTLLLTLLLLFSVRCEEEQPPAPEEAHEFTADISKMMRIIINSLYSNKDIFLRELISNAADAMNKVRIESQTTPEIFGEGDNAKLDIRISTDEDAHTLTIIDRGIGMNKTELVSYLGTIAHSGTVRFLDGIGDASAEADLIGQFGVGFYSSFLVANKVVVTSKRFGEKQHIWISNNAESFEIYEDNTGPDLFRGTKITLHLRDSKYSDPEKIKELALRYSEFIDFPIYLRVSHDSEMEKELVSKFTDDDDDEKPKVEPILEDGKLFKFVHLNARRALWLRDPANVTEAEYVEFYRTLVRDYNDKPLVYAHYNTNGTEPFKSILYIPTIPPAMEMTANRKYQSLKLYIHRVLIAEEFDDFIPRYMSFIRGVIDSDDLQLNVSREMLQESRALRAIGRKIVKRVIQMMLDFAEDSEKKNDGKYLEFYYKYQRLIKLGVMDDSTNRRRLARLLRFNTTKSETEPVSLDVYLERMAPDQIDFFFIAGDPATTNVTESPFLIPYRKRGIEVLYLTDPVDELVLKDLKEYDRKIFVCITQADRKQLTPQGEYEKEKLTQWRKRFKQLVNFFKEALGERVVRVEVSSRLAAEPRTPCVLSHLEGTASANMERYSKQQHRVDPRYTVSEGKKVLEVNPTNNLIKRMNVAVQQVEAEGIEGPDPDEDKDEAEARLRSSKAKLETLALLLYDTALFESGYSLSDVNEYSERVFEVLTRMTGLPSAPVGEDEDLLGELLREEEEQEMKEEMERMEEEEKEEKKKRKEEKKKQKQDEEEKEEEKEKEKEEEKEEKKEKKKEKGKKKIKDDL